MPVGSSSCDVAIGCLGVAGVAFVALAIKAFTAFTLAQAQRIPVWIIGPRAASSRERTHLLGSLPEAGAAPTRPSMPRNERLASGSRHEGEQENDRWDAEGSLRELTAMELRGAHPALTTNERSVAALPVHGYGTPAPLVR